LADPLYDYQCGRSSDWIKVKNPQSPAMLRLQEE
jgi:hypothetical protein